MPYDSYMAKCRGLGKAIMPRDEYDGADEEKYQKAVEGLDSDEDQELRRSLELDPDEEELAKSIEYLQAMAESSRDAQRSGRRGELAAKAAEGTLSKSERQELIQLTDEGAGSYDAGEDFAKSMDGPETRAAFEVSPFLATFAETFAKSLSEATQDIGGRLDGLEAFNAKLARCFDGLAKSLAAERREQGELIKGLQAEVERLGGMPVPYAGTQRLPISQVDPSPREGAPLAKSRVGGLDRETLEKSQKIGRREAQAALRTLYDRALTDKNRDEPLIKSLGGALSMVNVTSNPDWRRVEGMTPELVAAVVRQVG